MSDDATREAGLQPSGYLAPTNLAEIRDRRRQRRGGTALQENGRMNDLQRSLPVRDIGYKGRNVNRSLWSEKRVPEYCPHGMREDCWYQCDDCAIENLSALLAMARHAMVELRHIDQTFGNPGGNFQPSVYERWDALQADIENALGMDE